MHFNSSVFNSGIFNGESVESNIGSGNLLTFTQQVGRLGSGNLLTFTQTVEQYNIGSGDLLTFTQRVNAIASGNLLRISQLVTASGSINPNPPDPGPPPYIPIPHYIVRNGFYPVFTIGAYVWPDTNIYDRFVITGNEGDGRQLVFSLLFRKYTAYGPIDFEMFDGAPITLDIYHLSGEMDRIFTGRINKVDLDLIQGSVTCTCDDDRRNKIINEYALQTQNIGYYSEDVLGTPSDTFDALEQRLTTVPQSVDVDRFGQLQLSNLLPGEFAHFEFNDEDVYGNGNEQKADPKVEKLLRSRVINTVNISIDYQYQRRYHGTANYRWDWDTNVCEFLVDGLSLAKRATIQAAAEGTGWVMNPNPSLPRGQTIKFEEPPKNGLYNCPGVGVPIAFTTVQTSGVTYENETDEEGNPINGPDGKPVKKAKGGVFQDSRNQLAIGATWSMSFRWVQNVKETYTISVTAPQSVNRYGTIPQTDQASIDDSSDNSEWENYKVYQSAPFYTDYTPNRNRAFNAFNVLVNRAKTTIIKAHRDNRVTFCVPLTSSIEMYHTVYLNASRIQAYGKVVSISHYCEIADGNAYTEITIALCRSFGSASDSVFSFPSIPTQTPPTPNWATSLRSIYGEEPSANFKGFVGNKWKTQDDYTYGFRGSNTFKTDIQEQFIVKAPDIGAVYRDLLILGSGASYSMTLPNNLLSVSFL